MNPVAALLYGHDNDRYMVGSCEKRMFDVPDGVFCPTCGWKQDWTFTRPDFRLGPKKLDVSCTYDGSTIVSDRFRKILSEHQQVDDVLVALAEEPGFFHLVPRNVLTFDRQRGDTQCEDLCRSCGLYQCVAGSDTFLAEPMPAVEHLFRSDLLFGSYNEHSPLMIVSAKLGADLTRHQLTGMDLQELSAAHFGS